MELLVDGERRRVDIEMIVVAGYTGRDRAAVMHHIDELAEIGVPPPPRVPMYWKFPPWLAMQDDQMVVVGEHTSGEAELLLVVDGDEVLVSLASDHTDRAAEAVDIALSKAICPKMVARHAWTAASIGDRWGDLELHSRVEIGGAEVTYQGGPCSSLTPPLDLLAGMPFARQRRFAMLTGTVPVKGDIRPADRFIGELRDPATGRTITLDYRISVLGDR